MIAGIIKQSSVIPRLVSRQTRGLASLQFQERQTKVGGAYTINYAVAGKEKSDEVVLLLPGALGSARTDFAPQLEGLPALLPNHTILAWDPPGYGKSVPPARTFPVDFFERDAEAASGLLSALGIPKASVLGWSDGGITGMVMAAKYPKSVEKLVVWGANAYIHPDEVKIYESIRDVNKWSQKMRAPMEEMYGKEGFPKLWSEWIDGMVRIFKERGGDICKDLLSKITAPTLVVHGAKDPMILPEHVPFLLNNIKNSDVFVFPEGKHNIHLRFAKEFNEVVSKFLLNKS